MDETLYKNILSRIEKLSPVYAPEWRFNPSRPDFGSAVAVVFAEQLCGSMERFAEMAENHKIAFYNKLGASPLPAEPAKGVVCLKLSAGGTEGSLVPKAFKLFSPVLDEAGNRRIFETRAETFASPSEPVAAVFVDSAKDGVYIRDDLSLPFVPDKTAVKRKLAFEHDYIDKSAGNSRLYLKAGGEQSALWNEALCRPKNAGWVLIRDGEAHALTPSLRDGKILLNGFPASGGKSRIELAVKDISAFERLAPARFTVGADGAGIEPEAVFADGEEQTPENAKIYPFGRVFRPDGAVTFLCDGALNRKGASVTLKFTAGFDVITQGEPPPPPPLKKFIVLKKNILEPKYYDVVIKNAAWEYFNGAGFAPLPLNRPANRVFAGLDETGDAVKTAEYAVSFDCPRDMEPLLIGSRSGYCVRARLKEAADMFARPARIYAPYIQNARFDFKSPPEPVEKGEIESNFEKYGISEGVYFKSLKSEGTALWLGFDRPLEKGVIRLLIVCGEDSHKGAPPPPAECEWSRLCGGKLYPVGADDETKGFTRTGILSLSVDGEMSREVKYGEECYWVRAAFAGRPPELRIEKIFMNAVGVEQLETIKDERHYIDGGERAFTLKNKNIAELDLYALDEDLPGSGRERIAGDMFRADRSEGTVTFSESAGGKRAISADYRCGGGGEANVAANSEFIPSLNIGYVCKAFNPLPITGGTGKEEREAAISRFGRELRRGRNPVIRSDFED